MTVPTSSTVPAANKSAVGTTSLSLTEPATASQPARTLTTIVRYPAVGAPGGGDVVGARPLRTNAPYPLVIFSQGFDIQPEAYSLLLNSWAAAGYVVADPAYPFTSPNAPGGVVRTDIVRHPSDASFVISSLLRMNSQAGGPLSHLISPSAIGVIGQSDGGDVSLAITSNTCCRDTRVKAAVILSGAELSWFKGKYFATPGVPTLVVQGTNDLTMNPVYCSVQLYNGAPQPKYYLSMIGQTHLSAYILPGVPFRVVTRVTLDFLDVYLRHETSKRRAINSAGTVPGVASITSSPSVGPGRGSCPGAPTG
ncbi:MAG: alpha/beta hydrolase family protein [Acidimicrobiales bacterium]